MRDLSYRVIPGAHRLWKHGRNVGSNLLPPTKFTIAVPVRNEEDHLEAALESLANQWYSRGTRLPWFEYRVVRLANNCTDGSVRLASRFAGAHPNFQLAVTEVTLPPEKAHVGWARRLAMELAASSPFLATTDADSCVSPFWVAATLREFAAGADAVCGRIRIDERERCGWDGIASARHGVDETYRILVARVEDKMDPQGHDPWPRHFQHYGASFAVRRETYRLVGGVPPVSGLEDVAFYEELVAVDARVRHSPQVPVTTSGRRHGRAAIGLSAHLRDWDNHARTGKRRTALGTVFFRSVSLLGFTP